MNKKSVLSMIGLVSICMTCWAVENPNVSNPSSRPSNAPTHSGQRQRFISQPGSNPYGKTGNDIVTGNVGGGKHFRGAVPYGSSYYSGPYSRRSSGTRSVNRFIRRSADPLVNDRNPGQVNRYYDPYRTVSSLQRPDGTSGLSKPQMTGQGRRNQYIMPPIDPLINTQYRQRPLSSNNMDLEQILERQEQLRQIAKEETLEKKNFFEQNRVAEESEEQNDEKIEDETKPTLTPEQEMFAEIQKEQAEALKNQESILARKESDLLPKRDLEMIDTPKGKNFLGKHKTFAALADEKFATYMDAADDFIGKGQFYKAADTYALAIIWKPKDARAYLGQSFSLFAAGEYMSSGYYLSVALELDSTEALKKYDLPAFVGGRDTFENRILEMTTWQQRSGSGELALLMAYVSYQDGKAVRAQQAINSAAEAMPDSKAVMILKNHIDPDEIDPEEVLK